MTPDIQAYNNEQTGEDIAICNTLAAAISTALPEAENKIWHGHPVWFLEGNPIAGYSREKQGIRLMFWSGADFEEEQLQPGTGKFKDASIFYTGAAEINTVDLDRWLSLARTIQWDYKNLAKRKGKLERLPA